MRKTIISLIFILFAFVSTAQNAALTENKIIENGKEYYLYEVQESEGFMAIGRKFGVAYKDIIDANQESTKEGLKVGQILRIPVLEGRNSSNEEIKSDDFVYHKVDSGETVFFISRKYDVSIRDIVSNNPGSDNVLSIGQELRIPKVTEAATITYMKPSDTPKAATSVDSYQYHIVQPKETATGIARKYNISLQSLANANPGLEASNISIGAKLRIPEGDTEINEVLASEELTDTDYTYHRIKNGETLESIASLYSIPVSVINQSNTIGEQLPPVGYMLKIPHSYEFEVETSTENQEIYIVKKKDDIRRIAEHYQVPIMDIRVANPNVRKWTKLKKGTRLVIPTLSVESVDSLVTRIPESKEKEDLMRYFENQKKDFGDTINIAFVWPLYLELNDTVNIIKKVNPHTKEVKIKTRNPKIIAPINPIFREFYFGALMAINNLKNQGLVVNIKNYDTERGAINIFKTLDDSSLVEADIIIGPGFSDQAKPLAEFCLEQHIRLVLPFISDCKSLDTNPYIYNVLPTSGVEYAHISKEVAKRYIDANIILVKDGKGDMRETLIADLLKSELYNPDSMMVREISYQEINFNKGSMSGLTRLLKADKQNLIIIPENTVKLYTQVIPVMNNYISKHKEIDIKLLGFDEWQNFKQTELENIFNVECEIYSPLYADLYGDDHDITVFKNQYYDYFLTTPTGKYPYYGMLGYDVANYFLKGLSTYGNQLENNLQNIEQKGLCVDFDFQRVNNWGGFVNKTIYTIEYTKDFEINLVK